MSTYDSLNATEVRILDGPGVGSALLVQDTAAETSLATIAGAVASAKVAVTDAAAETSLATLAGTVSAGKVAVADAAAETALSTLAATVSGGRVQVSTSAGGATTCTKINAGQTAGAIKNAPGSLYGVVVYNTIGTTPMFTITDGVGGTILAVIPANQPSGDLPMYGGPRPYANSLYVNSGGSASPNETPQITVVYS